MTTTVQVRRALKPLLPRNPDVELIGRFLVIKPVHHILRGVYIDRSGDTEIFVPTKVVHLLSPARTMFTLGWGGRIPARSADDWRVTDVEAIALMSKVIEEEVLPELRTLISFEDFATFASRKNPFDPRVSYDAFTYTHMLVATAQGNFEAARKIWDSDSEISHYMTITAPSFYPALLAEDRFILADLLHQWEAQTISTYKLEKVWESTPFPLEVNTPVKSEEPS